MNAHKIAIPLHQQSSYTSSRLGPVTADGDTVTVHTFVGNSALAWLDERWPALYRQDPFAPPHASAGWLLGWASQLHPAAAPLLFVAIGNSGPLAALALIREIRGDGTVLIKPVSPYCEYVTAVGPGSQDPLVAEALARRLTDLAHNGAAVNLPDVPARSRLGLVMMGRRPWQNSTSRTAVVPLPLDVTTLPASIRRQHAQRERRLTAGGYRVTYRRSRTSDDLLRSFPVLEAMHAARWTAQGRTSPGPSSTDWAAVLRRCGPGEAFIAEAAVDGVPVASQLCLYRAHRCYSVFPAMNPDLMHLSPGHLLLRRLAADLADDGFTSLDLGPTVEAPGQIGYKSQYGPIWGINLTSVLDGTRVQTSETRQGTDLGCEGAGTRATSTLTNEAAARS